ncbi:MAG TPA: maleylpyruvate isomerase N-terminal domain-containing protein [Acidimicrobiia bacterium]|nr:maleylpyruvate isomerase N-terminal domain-containing protein [Acidimicrobiia bacterium]
MVVAEESVFEVQRTLAELAAEAGPDATTACAQWRVHDLVAHLVAGGIEVLRLVRAHLDGEPDSVTTPFATREAPWRAAPFEGLIEVLGQSRDVTTALEILASEDPDARILFTGWAMSANELATHARSELALHLWDVAGDDPTIRPHLASPDLTAHAVKALRQFRGIAECGLPAQWVRRLGKAPLRLRSPGQDDVVINGANGPLALAPPVAGADCELDAADRLLILWGRRSLPER